MTLALLLLACRPSVTPDTDTDTDADTDTGAPTGLELLDVSLEEPETAVHLARRLRVEASAPTTLELRIDDGLVVRVVSFPDEARVHQVPVLGLAAGHDIELTVAVSDGAGGSAEQVLPVFRTDELPERFPEMEVLAHDPAAMEPGYRMLNLTSPDGTLDWLVVFDEQLRLVWWREGPPNYGDVRMTDRGTLIGLQGDIVEIDLLGEELSRIEPGQRLHHELFPRPGGGWLSLGYGPTTDVADYPLTYDDPLGTRGPASIRPDLLLELDTEGQVESALSLTSVLDTGRIGFGSLDALGPGPVFDWSHANGIIALDDGGRIVSVRHQGALVKLDAAAQVQWILSDPAGWSAPFQGLLLQPAGEVSWPYAQHAPEWTDDGLLVVFDNHNDGQTPYAPGPTTQSSSRAIAYRVDEALGTVEVAWEIPAPGLLFCAALGDADVLPQTGNVLLDFGFLAAEEGVLNADAGRGLRAIRLVEAHPDRPDEPVLNLSLWGAIEDEPDGYKAYRAEHLPSLYPPDVAVRIE